MTDEDRMLEVVRNYWFDLGEPGFYFPESEFQRVSYSRWAVDEIMLKLLTHSDGRYGVRQAVEEFKNDMKMCVNLAHENQKWDNYSMFVIGYSVAEDLSDMLNAMI